MLERVNKQTESTCNLHSKQNLGAFFLNSNLMIKKLVVQQNNIFNIINIYRYYNSFES